MTTFHCQLDVCGLATFNDEDLRSLLPSLTDGDGQHFRDVHSLRTRLVDLLRKGIFYMPFGQPCDGWDPKTGCPGHAEEIAR